MLAAESGEQGSELKLHDGARIAVVGGGPAGSLFTHFAYRLAEFAGLDFRIDVFEPRRFDCRGPEGCNHCGGIVSESLVQLLATEGIRLPAGVVRRGLDAYMLHTDVGSVRIRTPLAERRIAAVFRGNGPRDAKQGEHESFDRFLLRLAEDHGARVVPRLVTGIDWNGERPTLLHPDGRGREYDLVVVASGINSNLLPGLRRGLPGYRPPRQVATYICEFQLDRDAVRRHFGNSMHVFLLDLPRLEFAALIPKGDVVTLCMLGDEIDAELVRSLLDAPEVRERFPPGTSLTAPVCNCSPMINTRGVARPYGDRIVFVGDAGVTRLYKDGIGAAYRTAKVAASTAVLQGISADAFRKHYRPLCREISRDNRIGEWIFAVNGQLRRSRVCRRAIRRMVFEEQRAPGSRRPMSRALWDLFTGSASYGEVLLTMLHPGFIGGLAWHVGRSLFTSRRGATVEEGSDGTQLAG
jgi:flavin-dependent dehydrogenase